MAPYWVESCPSRTTLEEHVEHLEELAETLNDLEASKAQLEADLTDVLETCKSLREDLSNFSTFEQICNSGMLRNFKIDSESPFAQVILRLLQQTMELQLSHLRREHEPEPRIDVPTALPETGWNTNPGVTEP
jgi:chromosome segregation ATPase